jgi:hypothetical protein
LRCVRFVGERLCGASVAVTSIAVFLAVSLSFGCAAPHRQGALTAIDARYVLSRQETERSQVVTRAYRNVLSQSLSSRCPMFPSDSELFDRRVRACGSAVAATLSIARLMLESAAGPDFLWSMTADGRVRWLDVPPESLCGF